MVNYLILICNIHLMTSPECVSVFLSKAFQNSVGTYHDQRRPVIPLLSAMRRCAKPSEEQMALRKAWDTMEERVNSAYYISPNTD